MKFLICHDGSEQAERALKLGAEIAAGCQAEVTLLGINETPAADNALLESLQRGQALLANKKIQAELITKSGEPINEIMRRTEETQYDLVVIGAARKQNRGRFWMSSKTYKIIKEIAPPVLSVAGKNFNLDRILVCSGGKQYIEKALQLAGLIARGLKAKVSLLHVMPKPPALYAHLQRIEETPEWLLNSRSELGRNLGHGKQILESLGVTTEVRLRQGLVLEEILSEILEGKYGLVVTGSALSRSLRTYVLGDISREIVNRSDCAVLVVRTESKPHEFRFRTLFGKRVTKQPTD